MSRRQGSYSIDWTRSALRALKRLPEKVAVAIVEFVYGQLADNPQRAGHPLRFELEGHHTAARGDFRIIYAIDMRGRRVLVEAIAHRSDVYRTR